MDNNKTIKYVTNKLIGKKILQTRNLLEISPVEMARIMKCSYSAYLMYEKGKVMIPAYRIALLCNSVAVNVEQIMPTESEVSDYIELIKNKK